MNLLENALRVSREPVRISASAHDGEVVLRVIDRGEGISLRDVDRIFDAFERGSGELGGGSGLGLAIARGFAQANGGRLFVEEPPDGRGASFALALPAAQAPARVNA